MAIDYQARIALPSWIVRGATTIVELPVAVDSTLTAPSAGTYTLYRPDSTAAISAQNVTVTDNVATYSISSGTLSSESLGEGWLEEWALTLGGVAKTFRRDAALVRTAPPRVVSTADLEQRHPELRGQYPAGDTNWERAIEEAHISVELELLKRGRRPYLVISPWSLREPELLFALAYAFRSIATYSGEESRFSQLADKYERMAKAAMTDLVLTYDGDNTGVPDEAKQGQGVASVIFLSAPGPGADWRRY